MAANDPMTASRYKEIEGYWGFVEKISAPGTLGRHSGSVINFRFDGEFITLRLVSISPDMDDPGDGFFKLRTRWNGESLSCLLPNGAWEELAFYENGEFSMWFTDEKHRYVKIESAEVKDWNQDLLIEDRELYAY